MLIYDLRNATFEQFVHYIFEDIQSELENWDSNSLVHFDSSEFAKHYTELFLNPTFLLDRFNLKQLHSGFWEMQSCNMPGNVCEIIYDSKVPFELRHQCIESMYTLYAEVFTVPLLSSICDMWWDGIAYGYCCGNYSRKNQDHRQIQDSMFFTLCRILSLPSEPCQYGALHGLGHLRHPDTKQVIEAFLESHETFADKDYARACIIGDMM